MLAMTSASEQSGRDGVSATAVRLVVTKIADGLATYDETYVEPVVQRVDPSAPLMQAGKTYTTLWGTGSRPAVPVVGSNVTVPAMVEPFFAGPGETRFVLFTLPSAGTAQPGWQDPGVEVPGLTSHFDSDGSGMHATDTLDYVVVLSGQISLELDEGVQVHLAAGDCVVQRGTRHAWRNTSGSPATLVGIILGADRVDDVPATPGHES